MKPNRASGDDQGAISTPPGAGRGSAVPRGTVPSQRRIRPAASRDPRHNPYVRTAAIPYALHDGVKRHRTDSRGEMKS